ncbi:MAG: DNA-binding protein [Terriglobales bacterium]
MNRKDLQSLADERLGDAKVLLASNRYGGAYYLIGYAVECGLKACIAKLTQAEDFYDKNLAKKIFQHDLEQLANHARLSAAIEQSGKADPLFEANWAQVILWSEESRYETHIRAEAEQMMQAVENPDHGVMQCIKRYW